MWISRLCTLISLSAIVSQNRLNPIMQRAKSTGQCGERYLFTTMTNSDKPQYKRQFGISYKIQAAYTGYTVLSLGSVLILRKYSLILVFLSSGIFLTHP